MVLREQSSSANSGGMEDTDLFADAMRFVQDLHLLSSQLANDASEDDHVFGKAAESTNAGKRTT